MNDVPETCHVHKIRYLRFYNRQWTKVFWLF